jgi:hypothetical protein
MFQIVCLLAFLAVVAAEYKNELVLLGDDKIGSVVKTKLQYKKLSELPASLDYRTLGLMTTDLNQHIPVYWYVKINQKSIFKMSMCSPTGNALCSGSCWAHAPMSSLADRIKIMTNGHNIFY